MIAERTAVAAAVEAEGRVQTAPPVPQTPPAQERPPRRESPGPRRSRKGSWRSPMTAAVLVGTFLVSLLCIYVDAYARVTTAGFQLSLLRRDLRRAKQEEDALNAELGNLRMPSAVARRAQDLGMVMQTDNLVMLDSEDRRRALTPRSGR